ncbi:mitochondrial carrier domain-containing protein [Phakopsora pachyrhizi]|uniref:Mitochondrial carrier domain-containing protein n=1 Tax=Phakopsora pachyrhizi TaxID=170000 RepID=A0AAV0BAF7_PHAPC|nr:mitochondrial carrier domain-containing protein [Phakopsora pachyrhizi]CAH7682615.1 mitochondrial carrier domain-containing protein [Phakopsora pachyrhizi]
MSMLFPSMNSLSSSFTNVGSLNNQPTPMSTLRFMNVLEDAKSKLSELENRSKSGFEGFRQQISVDNSTTDSLKSKLGVVGGGSGGGDSIKKSGGGIELYSNKYYAACAAGGVLACGLTHALVTPLDLVKCRRQVDKNLYKGNLDGWSKIYRAGGLGGLYTGIGPTFLGYSIQGSCKYGFYEYFKKKYSDAAGPVNAVKYKDAIYLAGSASAELIADAAFVPFEAVKVRMQTTIPPFAANVRDGFQKFVAIEGTGGLYKSLGSLWSRQIPYTMMKFWSFEATVAKIYAYLGKPKDSYNKLEQLGVSFVGGYIAGVFCAVVSHPADTMVSKLNAAGKEGSAKPTVGSIYKEIGFGGLWAGLGTRIVMIGTLTALQWLIYDYVKVIAGLPTTGSAEPKKA